MSHRVRTLVFGVTDPAQAIEADHLGVDAVVVVVGEEHPAGVDHERAEEIALALPPLALRLAWLVGGASLPRGYSGAVTPTRRRRPRGAGVHVLAVEHDRAGAGSAGGWDAVWLRPREGGSSSATRFDYALVERMGRSHPLILEIPDGASGVETAIRLGQPYGVAFGESVWFRPGIVDVDELERALAVVARLARSPGSP